MKMFLDFPYKVDDLLIFGVLLSQLIRWSVSRWSYSGAGKPPMYGDYEAQRHWMEITANLPYDEWYKNSSQNDLLYWGLDYPPLSAYQSKVLGHLAEWFNPEWIALYTSRGYEGYEHKIFMRCTVIALDILCFYVPVILYWSLSSHPVKLRDKGICASLMLLYPGLILVDHGHFQYNCVSLGLSLTAVLLMMLHCDLSGAMLYTLALHYKQMSLYYALPFFFYLFGSCFQLPKQKGLMKFVKLSSVVICTSAICWAPFLCRPETFFQVLSRLFPVNRGLYEDKVANVWCSLSIIVKFKVIFSPESLFKISAVTTLFLSMPSSLHLFRKPNLRSLILALVNSSLIFFLFSYQVHEKSILFPAFMALLLVEDHPFVVCWFSFITTFSLLPLLAKEGLVIPYIALSVMFVCGVIRAYNGMGLSFGDQKSTLKTVAFCLSLCGSVILLASMFHVKSPKKYPHLHIVLNCIYSCAHFLGFAIYFHYVQFVEDLPSVVHSPGSTKQFADHQFKIPADPKKMKKKAKKVL